LQTIVSISNLKIYSAFSATVSASSSTFVTERIFLRTSFTAFVRM